MKFKYNSWLMLVICGIYTTYFGGALADNCYKYSKSTNPGTWCDNYNKCPKGCYCTGQPNSKFSGKSWEDVERGGGGISNLVRMEFEKICKSPNWYNLKEMLRIRDILVDGGYNNHGSSATEKYWMETARKYNSATDSEKRNYIYELMKSIGMYTCPAEFPSSDIGEASKEADCYASVNGQKVYNKTLNCKAGQYLPRNSNSCTACKTGERYYCPGGTFHASTSHDMGLKIKCDAGQYLPGGASSCQKCKTSSRYYVCSGGTFASYFSSDQGIRKCTGGSVANSDRTACEYTSSSTSKTTTTKITLTKNQMKFGFKGSTTPVESQCWTKYKNKGEYISCVMKRYY